MREFATCHGALHFIRGVIFHGVGGGGQRDGGGVCGRGRALFLQA